MSRSRNIFNTTIITSLYEYKHIPRETGDYNNHLGVESNTQVWTVTYRNPFDRRSRVVITLLQAQYTLPFLKYIYMYLDLVYLQFISKNKNKNLN